MLRNLELGANRIRVCVTEKNLRCDTRLFGNTDGVCVRVGNREYRPPDSVGRIMVGEE